MEHFDVFTSLYGCNIFLHLHWKTYFSISAISFLAYRVTSIVINNDHALYFCSLSKCNYSMQK